MKTAIGLLLMLAGVAFGVYIGVWVMLIGGIVQIIEAIKATPVPALDIAIGIARVLLAGFAGVVSALVAIFPGWAMVQD